MTGGCRPNDATGRRGAPLWLYPGTDLRLRSLDKPNRLLHATQRRITGFIRRGRNDKRVNNEPRAHSRSREKPASLRRSAQNLPRKGGRLGRGASPSSPSPKPKSPKKMAKIRRLAKSGWHAVRPLPLSPRNQAFATGGFSPRSSYQASTGPVSLMVSGCPLRPMVRPA